MTRTRGPDGASNWLLRRGPRWLDVERRLRAAHLGQDATEALALVRDYREVMADYAIARHSAGSPGALAYLEGLVSELRDHIHRRQVRWWPSLLQLLRRDMPTALAGLRPELMAVSLLFCLSALAGWFLVQAYPGVIGLFASEDMISGVQRGELWTDGLLNVIPSSVLSVAIFTNNIVVALTACCLGIFFVLGTAYIIGLNGFMLGGVFAFTAQYGMADELLQFILPHGPVELTAIVISGAAGVSLGQALFQPGEASRGVALERAGRRAAHVMLVCVLFLVGAGVIEGYISPDPAFPAWSRALVGGSYLLLLVAVATRGWLQTGADRPG